MDYVMILYILLPSLSILISIFIGLYTVNRRVENENKESHKPYLVVDQIDPLKEFHMEYYFLTFFGRNYLEQHKEICKSHIFEEDPEHTFFVALGLKNIGYGVASDIRFYNLLTGKEIIGTQKNIKSKNQKLFTTFDIATEQRKEIPVKMFFLLEEDEVIKEDHNRILCIYKDLNDHIYDAIITINMKTQNTFDYFIYQRTSRSYKKWITENKKQYKKIQKEYRNWKKK